MHSHFTTAWRTRIAAGAFAAVLSVFALTASVQAADPNMPVDAIRTATPIKHVIIIVGENRSFDHLFATYAPSHAQEGILNLLSEGIVNALRHPRTSFCPGASVPDHIRPQWRQILQ
jgi:phospholipase C